MKKFYAVLDVEDDSSRDEIEVVPFVKPPPVVIELDLSDDDHQHNRDLRQNGSSSPSLLDVKLSQNIIDKVSGGGEEDKINVDTSGDVDKPDVVAVTNDAVPSSDTTELIHSSPSLPEIRIAQSIFETDESHLEEEEEGAKVKDLSKVTKKPGAKVNNTTKKRKRLSSAGSGGRTAEEIQKLLSTLGVLGDQPNTQEDEVVVFEKSVLEGSSSPVAPKKKPKKTSTEGQPGQTSRPTSPPKKPRKPRSKSQVEEPPSSPLSLEHIVDNSNPNAGEGESYAPVTLKSLMEPPEVPSLRVAGKRGRPKLPKPRNKTQEAPPPPPPATPAVNKGPPLSLETPEDSTTPTGIPPATPFVSVEEPPKKNTKKRSRTSLEKPSAPVEDVEFTAEELNSVNLSKMVTNIISSPQKKKQKSRELLRNPEEDPVESISVILGLSPEGQSQRVVRLHAAQQDSDVATKSHLPSTWSQEMVAFYDTPKDENLAMSDVLGGMSGDRRLWTIPTASGGGFGAPPKPKVKRIRCDNCKQWGHLKRLCPDPPKVTVCIYCGLPGHNGSGSKRSALCRKTQCLNCGKSQSRFTSGCDQCIFTRCPPVCSLCGVEGHKWSSCPDNWRRFHSTTSVTYVSDENGVEDVFYNNGELLDKPEYRERRQSFCANCGRKGHLLYACRSHHRMSQYRRPKPNILTELSNPVPKPSKEAPAPPQEDSSSSPVPPAPPAPPTTPQKRKVTLQEEQPIKGNKEEVETIRIEISNNPTTASDNNKSPQPEDTWKCANHPECSNRPSLGQSCHVMFLIPCDHSALLQSQTHKNSGLESIKTSNDVQICVLPSRHVAHIFGHNHVRAKEEILDLVKTLKMNQQHPKTPEAQSIQIPTNPTTQESPEDSSTELKPIKKPPTPPSSSPPDQEIIVLPPPSPPKPEIITLDDSEDDDTNFPPDLPNSSEILTVSLLASEWDLIFPLAKFNHDDKGILGLLASTFSVSVFVSKETLTVTIQRGDDEGRTLAKENLVYWLECQAGGVDFSLQYERRHDQKLVGESGRRQRGKNFQRNQKRRMNKLKSHFKKMLNVEGYLDRQGTSEESQRSLPQITQWAHVLPDLVTGTRQISPPEFVDFCLSRDSNEQQQQPTSSTAVRTSPETPAINGPSSWNSGGTSSTSSGGQQQQRRQGSSGGGQRRQQGRQRTSRERITPGSSGGGGGSSRSRGGGQQGQTRRYSRWDTPQRPQQQQQQQTQRPVRYFNANNQS